MFLTPEQKIRICTHFGRDTSNGGQFYLFKELAVQRICKPPQRGEIHGQVEVFSEFLNSELKEIAGI